MKPITGNCFVDRRNKYAEKSQQEQRSCKKDDSQIRSATKPVNPEGRKTLNLTFIQCRTEPGFSAIPDVRSSVPEPILDPNLPEPDVPDPVINNST
ncbi:hypothetical protein DPMN_060944 [Dreissena polymorpha]|uniref:Uncharacterized protein n=1 Tax=Dreissena polymorpha TaxID=45954 RepID=A0A9D4HGF2_DREPO|nr:hypothetical protein DPMN_060944 [Dreissena polymorpha]